jgi:hypothetical protein
MVEMGLLYSQLYTNSHSYKGCHLLGYSTMQSVGEPTFWYVQRVARQNTPSAGIPVIRVWRVRGMGLHLLSLVSCPSSPGSPERAKANEGTCNSLPVNLQTLTGTLVQFILFK